MTDTTTDELPDTFGIGIVTTYIGERKDADGWEHFLWHVTLVRDKSQYGFDYRMGLAHVDPPKRKSLMGYRQPGWKPYPGHRYRSDELPTPTPPTLLMALGSIQRSCQCHDWDEYDELLDGVEPYSKQHGLALAIEREARETRRLLGRDYDRFMETEFDV